jgi:hypothetical protein
MLDAAQAPVLCFLHNFKNIAALQRVTIIASASFYVLELLTSLAFLAGIPYAQPGIFDGLLKPPTSFNASFDFIYSFLNYDCKYT